MELHSDIPPPSTVMERPPILRIARARESFPGKLIVPNIHSQMDVPPINVVPPPVFNPYSRDTRSYHHDHPDDLGSNIYTPAHHLRHLSVSSCATQYTQRTQSTLQVIPTRIISTSKQHQRGTTSTGRGGRANTSISFSKKNLRRGSTPVGGDDHQKVHMNDYQELESQVTESPSGFHYAATPPAGDVGSSRDLQAQLHVRRMQSSPVPRSRERCCLRMSIAGGIKIFEALTKRFKILFRAGQDVGEWKTSIELKGSKAHNPRTKLGGVDLCVDRGKVGAIDTLQATHCQKIGGYGDFAWGPGEKILRIKNNGTGSCVFMVTTTPGNPQEIIEIPLPLAYLQRQLFVYSKTLICALEDWNKHFQNPPPHWVINFVPKAYLRRGWHLAEDVAEYLRIYGLNAGVDSNSSHRSAWKVEYEAIGHKACLVGEGGKPYSGEGYPAGLIGGQNLFAGNGVRERHPSRCWERKEGWDGLVIGLAL